MAADDRLNETLRLLTSIDASLKQLVRQSATSAPVEIADDRELDSKYGDPEVRFNPRDWTGNDYKGSHFSACPPDFLELLAKAYDYFARKADESNELSTSGKPVAPMKRKDAARARGWAKRNRERGVQQPALAGPSGDDWPETGNDDGFSSEWN